MSELLFKVIIIGDATVGKTSFVKRYVNNHSGPGREYKPTVGGRLCLITSSIFLGIFYFLRRAGFINCLSKTYMIALN